MSQTEIIETARLDRRLFEGAAHGGIPVSFFVSNTGAGGLRVTRIHPSDRMIADYFDEADGIVSGSTSTATGGHGGGR